MRARWDALAARERHVLTGGAAVVALLLVWAYVWHPISLAREQLAQRVAADRASLAWMRGAQREVSGLSASGARASADRQGKSLLALADLSARGAGLATARMRVEPSGARSVRVSFEGVNFDGLVGWIEGLARDYGVQATDMSTDRVEGLGLVNARVTLEDGQ